MTDTVYTINICRDVWVLHVTSAMWGQARLMNALPSSQCFNFRWEEWSRIKMGCTKLTCQKTRKGKSLKRKMFKNLQDHCYFQVKKYSLFYRGSFSICVFVLTFLFSILSLNECITTSPIFYIYTYFN